MGHLKSIFSAALRGFCQSLGSRWLLAVALLFSVANQARGSLPCAESIFYAASAATTFPSLAQYKLEDPPLLEKALADPEFMVGVHGVPKTFVRAYQWYGSSVTISQYGRPYLLDGEWHIDFHALSEMPKGSRLLWRMPVSDFYEGVRGQTLSESLEAFLFNSMLDD